MFEAPQCALKSNQPSVSGTNCNEEMSENAFSLALNWRRVLLWWHTRDVFSGPSQPQSPGALQIHTSPCSLWAPSVESCLLVFSAVACASQHLQNAVQKPYVCVIKAGLEGCLQKQRLLPSYQMCVCVLKKKKTVPRVLLVSASDIICSMGTTSYSLVCMQSSMGASLEGKQRAYPYETTGFGAMAMGLMDGEELLTCAVGSW